MSALQKALSSGLAIMLVLSLIVGVMAYRQVPAGHAGVEKDWGAVTGDVADSGAHWKVPIMTTIQTVEIRPRTYTMSQTESEGDKSRADGIIVKTVNGSSVQVDITVRYRIIASEADQFVRDWNNERQMEKRLIRPTIRSVLRDEASSLQTTGDGAIYTQDGRQALEEAALTALEDDFEDEPVVLEAIQIRNVDLPDEIDAALDKKEQAKQQVQVEQERVQQEKARAKQKIVQARADAEAIEIRGEALRENPVVLEDRLIDAYDEGTVFVTDGNTEMIMESGTTNSTRTTATG